MGMQSMGATKWLFILLLGITASLADDMENGRERDFSRLSKRDLLRLSKKSFEPDIDYDEDDYSGLQFSKKDLLRLSKKGNFQESVPLHMSQRSLRLSKRSTNIDQPMVIRLSKRQIGQLLNIKRASLNRDLRLSKRSS